MAEMRLPIIHCTTCETPYVLRHAFVGLALESRYIWAPDCKHKVKNSSSYIVSSELAPVVSA